MEIQTEQVRFNYDKTNWSVHWRQIHTFIQYGLLEFSTHALEQMEKRHLTVKDVREALLRGRIIQCHAPHTYNDNEDLVFVIETKPRRKRKLTLRVVLAKEQANNGGIIFRVITAFVPIEQEA